MTYLVTQIFVLLLLAALLGALLGWYLTRLSAAAARASLEARLRSAETDARELRTELDAAVNAKGQADAERLAVTEELLVLQGQHEGAATDDRAAAEIAALRAELDQCRSTLAKSAEAAYDEAEVAAEAEPATTEPSVDATAVQHAAAAALAAAPGLQGQVTAAEADDLQQIKGIGPKIAGILAELGIQRLDQIAAWDRETVAWVNGRLKFKGRVEREQWIEQAQALLEARMASD